MENLKENEFMFKSNDINSTYFYHTKDNQIEYFEIHVRVCDEKINVINEKLTYD